jgi:hypothetical protein
MKLHCVVFSILQLTCRSKCFHHVVLKKSSVGVSRREYICNMCLLHSAVYQNCISGLVNMMTSLTLSNREVAETGNTTWN